MFAIATEPVTKTGLFFMIFPQYLQKGNYNEDTEFVSYSFQYCDG